MPTRQIIIDFTKFACFVGTDIEDRKPDAWVWALTDDEARQSFAQAKSIDAEQVTIAQ